MGECTVLCPFYVYHFSMGFRDSRGPVNSDHAIHCMHSLNRMIRYTVVSLCVLPAYSPDFNPIEQAFSSIKSYMRRNYNYLSPSRLSALTHPMKLPYTQWRTVHSPTCSAGFCRIPVDSSGLRWTQIPECVGVTRAKLA